MPKDTSLNICQNFSFSFPSLEQTDFIFRRLVEGTDYLILVIGEQGSGKTHFLKRFISTSASTWSSCRIKMQRAKDGSKQIHLLRSSNAEDAYISNDGNAPILLIDDAHRFEINALRALLNAGKPSARDTGLKHIVLFCEPDFLSRIWGLKPSLPAQSGINKLYMPKLTENQTAEFISKWFETETTSTTPLPPLKTRQLKTIYRISAGIPGNVLEAVKQVFWKNSRKYPRSILSAIKAGWRHLPVDAPYFTT